MQVFKGMSQNADAIAAVDEATSTWPRDSRLNCILVFHSTKQDAHVVSATLAQKFPGVAIAGCTTSGEHLDGKHYNGSLVVTGIVSPDISWKVAVIEDLKTFDGSKAKIAVDHLLASLDLTRESISPERQFCLTFIDGLSCKEEVVAAGVAEALEGLPLIGGSAGDDLAFKRTQIIANGRAYDNAAVLVLADSKAGFHILKHQHFIKTPRQLVITKVDVAARRVHEMDGLPAAEAYANALGMPLAEVTPDVCFVNPLTFRCNNEIYVRSIQKIENDATITFYCGIEEGMVLEIGGHEDMGLALKRDIKSALGDNRAELLLSWNCILRALEATKSNKHEELGDLMMEVSRNVIGFDTYGEQLNGLHINQTLVGIALRRSA